MMTILFIIIAITNMFMLFFMASVVGANVAKEYSKKKPQKKKSKMIIKED